MARWPVCPFYPAAGSNGGRRVEEPTKTSKDYRVTGRQRARLTIRKCRYKAAFSKSIMKANQPNLFLSSSPTQSSQQVRGSSLAGFCLLNLRVSPAQPLLQLARVIAYLGKSVPASLIMYTEGEWKIYHQRRP